MQEREPTALTGADRLQRMLRDQVRIANEHSTSAPPGFAARDERSADELTRTADEFRDRLTAEQLEALDIMSDERLRWLATGSRWLAWLKGGDA